MEAKMEKYALINNDGILLQERAFNAFPSQPNPVKGFQWYALTEAMPPCSDAQKVEGYTLSIDAKNSTATKTYTVISKSAEELATMAEAAQKAKDLQEIIAVVKKAESLGIKELADIAELIKSMAKGMYWLIKDQKG